VSTIEREVEEIKRKAVRTGLILLNDKSMSPSDRHRWALATIEAASQQVEHLEKKL